MLSVCVCVFIPSPHMHPHLAQPKQTTVIGTLTQTCNNQYFWSLAGEPLTRACTNTIVMGSSSFTYTEYLNATSVGIVQGQPTPMDTWTTSVISKTGTGIFKQGR